MTPTPRDRARRAFLEMPDNPSENDFMEIVTAAVQAERNAGDQRLEDAQAALQAALEDLAGANSALTSEQIAHGKTMRERDGLAAALVESQELAKECKTVSIYSTKAILAAHDRAVAARVLREISSEGMRCLFDVRLLEMIAAQYESGKREVPGE